MQIHNHILSSVAPAALVALSCTVVKADLLPDQVISGVSGDGLIFADPAEGVSEPGLKAVTFTRTRVPDGSGGFIYVDPFEVILTDLTGLGSRGEVTNCLMANNPAVFCDSESGSGKRIKAQLTGRNPFDVRHRVTPSAQYPSVDYFTFGKVSNFTGARMTGFTLELLDANGNPMGNLSPDDAVLFNLAATNIGIGGRLPDGLFGAGGQEGDIGFFSDDRAILALAKGVDTLEFGALSNPEYVANFGTAFLDDNMVPDGLFWDDNGNPNDESALIAWNNIAGGGLTYGTIETAANLDARLSELAASLGVSVAELGYAPGALVPAEIVAAAEANGLFEVAAIEDLRNANLNYTITVGTVDGQEFILRYTPIFAPIVTSAQDAKQFAFASNLDAAANIPYWDLGNAEAYRDAINGILALSPSGRANALNSVGFSFAPAFYSLGFEAARGQVAAIFDSPVPWSETVDSGGVVAQTDTSGAPWKIGDGVYGLFSASGSQAYYDPTNGSVGYDVDYTSFSLGVEKRLTETNTSIGLALGYVNGSADADNNLGNVDADGYSISLFSRTRFGDGGLFQAVFGYQDLSYDSSRHVLGQTASGDTDGSTTFAGLKIEYLKNLGSFKVGPTASIEYYDVSTDSFTETGGGIWNLDVNGLSGSTSIGSIGVRGEYELAGSTGDSRLTGSLAYTSISGDDLIVESGFVGLPGITLPADGLDDDFVDVSLGFDSVIASHTNRLAVLSGGYRGTLGSDYESHSLQLGLSIEF